MKDKYLPRENVFSMKNIIGVINFLMFVVSKLVNDVGRGENIFMPGVDSVRLPRC